MKRLFLCLSAVGALLSACTKDETADYPHFVDDVCAEMTDATLANYCSRTYDADGDGKVTIAEAANVQELDISGMGINSLHGIEYFGNLVALDCSGNSLSKLNLTKNPALEKLDCSGCPLLALDLTQNTELRKLNCSNTALKMLDLGQKAALTELVCTSTSIKHLDVAGCPMLKRLDCRNSNLHKLNIRNNWELIELYCSGNSLVSLNVIETALHTCTANAPLQCYMPSLQILYMKRDSEIHGININRTSSYIYNNTHILYDTAIDPNTVYFADAALRDYMIYNYDTNEDGRLSKEEARQVTEVELWYEVQSAEGLEHCTSLTKLDCSSCYIHDLYPSNYPNLAELYCNSTGIEVLDLSRCPKLTVLECADNNLKKLDLTKCPNLVSLECSANDLTSLNLTNNTAVEELYCSSNLLEMLDVKGLSKLKILDCSNNSLRKLNVKANTKLSVLACEENLLSELDLSGNKELNILHCYDNAIVDLDVSMTALHKYDRNEYGVALRCAPMPALEKLHIDSSWGLYGITISRSTDYIPSSTEIVYTDDEVIIFPDENFHQYMMSTFDDGDGRLFRHELAQVTDIACSSKNIQDLSGIEYCTALETLNVANNQISSLDLSNNPAIWQLYCYNNTQLEALDLRNNIMVKHICCDNCALKSLNVTNCGYLQFLTCIGNQLSKLDVSGSPLLTALYCDNNMLTALNIGSNPELQTLNCDNNRLQSLDASGLEDLKYLYCSYNELTQLNVDGCMALYSLTCHSNQLSSLDLSNCGIPHSAASHPLDCAPMSSLQTIYLKVGWGMSDINPTGSTSYVPSGVSIAYK